MRRVAFLGLSALGLTAGKSSSCDKSDFYGKTAVVDLCDSHFPDKKSENVWMVEFYAPWCGHCQALKPKFIDAAKQTKKNADKYDGIKFGAVDCTKEQYLCQKYNVKGYPTLKAIVSGKAKEYQGPREADDMLEFVVRLKDSKGTKGGSSKCSSSLLDADKKEVVALCSSHFPDRKSKNNWVIVFHSTSDTAQSKSLYALADQINPSGAKIGVVDCNKDASVCESKLGSTPKTPFVVKTFTTKAKQLSDKSIDTDNIAESMSEILELAKKEIGSEFNPRPAKEEL
jgi:protein disulfide-isomerase-like protein